jgi:site-specific recombinase XerD
MYCCQVQKPHGARFVPFVASSLATKGKADLGTIADLLGHVNLQQTRRYTHFTESHTAEVVQRMADAVFHKYHAKVPSPEV